MRGIIYVPEDGPPRSRRLVARAGRPLCPPRGPPGAVANVVRLAPRAVPDANWQPGVIAGSERYRVFVDGEPAVGAFAARCGPCGWAVLAVGRPAVDELEGDDEEAWPTRHEWVTGEVRVARCGND